MSAALQGLWRVNCVLDPVTLGQTIADIAQAHFNVYIIYCSNGIYQNRKLNELMSVNSACCSVLVFAVINARAIHITVTIMITFGHWREDTQEVKFRNHIIVIS